MHEASRTNIKSANRGVHFANRGVHSLSFPMTSGQAGGQRWTLCKVASVLVVMGAVHPHSQATAQTSEPPLATPLTMALI